MSVPSKPNRIVLLASDGASTRIVYHALKKEFSDLQVILEKSVPRSKLIQRRISKLGILTVLGQLLFMSIVTPFLRWTDKKRIEEIKREYGLDDSPITESVVNVPSVNSDEARQALQQFNPELVVINGTRIIGRQTLSCVKATFINTHMGITPLFRGVHGGYWALVEGRSDLVGTTVHFVDEGIDTGNIIAQATFKVSPKDSFVTYPFLHIAVALPILINAMRGILTGTLQREGIFSNLPSKLRSHPTLWGYLGKRFLKGIK
jgi:folate-dependent phosphoribosylglycinamide formyltransferase PurN